MAHIPNPGTNEMKSKIPRDPELSVKIPGRISSRDYVLKNTFGFQRRLKQKGTREIKSCEKELLLKTYYREGFIFGVSVNT